MNKDNKNQEILEQMIESATMEGLTVSQGNVLHEYEPYCFSSHIDENQTTMHLYCWLDSDSANRYANILLIIGDSEDLGMNISDLMEIADDTNGHLSLYHLAPCPDCGSLQLRAGLIISGKDLPRSKFRWLLQSMIEEGKHIRSYLNQCMSETADCHQEDSQEDSPDECFDAYPHRIESLKEIADVLGRLKLPVANDFRKDGEIYFDVSYQSYPDLMIRVGIRIEKNPDRVVFVIASPNDIVPDDQASQVLELTCRINKCAVVDHVYIHPVTRRPIVQKGILMTAGILDSNEVESAVRTILGNGSFYLRMIREQISSHDRPEDVFRRMYGKEFPTRIESKCYH